MSHTRLAAWADRRLLPGLLAALLVADLLVGAVWVLTRPSQFSSPAYDAAQMVAPMRWWGAVFLVLASVTGTALVLLGRSCRTGYLVGPTIGGVWVGWALLFALGSIGRPGASLTVTVFAAALAALHLLAGLAVAHRPGDLIGR